MSDLHWLGDLAFTVGGVFAAIFGTYVAVASVTSHRERLSCERGQQLIQEHLCGAVVDFTVITPNFCRYSMYREFFVIRAFSMKLQCRYTNIAAVQVSDWLGFQSVKVKLFPSAEHESIRLLLGDRSERVAELLIQACATGVCEPNLISFGGNIRRAT